jgi:uncharacterized protein YeaO (DUF488 family)
MPVRMVRIYDDDQDPAGAKRILVDRLWPRGVKKERAQLDEWMKDVAPSADLRTWYGHEPSRFSEFSRRYRAELRRDPAASALDRLVEMARQGPVTLLTATRDLERSGAAVLANVVKGRIERPAEG